MIFKSYILEQNISKLQNNLVLFYGENLGLKDDFKKKIRKLNQKTYVKNLGQDEVLDDIEKFYEEVYNESLFDEKKIFFINQVNDKILEVVKELEKNGKKNIFFFSGLLEKKSKLRTYFEKSRNCVITACYGDNEITLKKIILEKLNNQDGLTPQNINIIIENCNLDRSKLDNELNKINSYFNSKKIKKEELEILLNIKENDNFNNLKDEALSGNIEKTNKLIGDTIIEPDKKILYLNMINQRLLKLLEINKIAKSSNLLEAIDTIRPPIFWKDKPALIIQLKKWNINKITNLLKQTYDLEFKIKSNSFMNHQILIKKLMIDICVTANA